MCSAKDHLYIFSVLCFFRICSWLRRDAVTWRSRFRMLISLGFLWLSLWMCSSKTNQNESLRWCCTSWVLTLFSIFLWRTDTQTEIDLVCRIAEDSGASAAVPCYHWSRGGRGSVELAHAVKEAASRESHFRFLYNLQVRLVYQQNFEWQVGCFKHDQEFLCFMPY